MSTEHALEHLARQTAEAVQGVLATFGGDGIVLGGVSVVERGGDPLRGMPAPGVAAEVGYVDGVTGGNVLCVSVRAARRLANAMMGMDPSEDVGDEPLSELELSAVSEAANQTMAAAAQATSGVLEQEIEISPPDTRTFDTTDGVIELSDSSAHVTCATLTVFGEACRLVQVVPTAFTVRMTRALDERELEVEVPVAPEAAVGPPADFAASLSAARVRLWAELGRRRMLAGDAVGLPHGSILELDRAPDDPIDVYVNGRRLALGRLVITDGGRWALRVEEVLDTANTENQSGVR